MKSSDYKETKLITEIATQIIEDPSSLIEKYFDSSLKNLLKFNTKFGTIAHICVYLREAEYLRKLICRFDEPRNLYQWLSEKDLLGSTAIELAHNFDFEEMNILFEKVIKNEISPKNTEIILKEAILDKYTNIMNGYKQRLVKLTTESLIYSKKDEQESVKISLKELKLEYTEDHKKIRLINLSNENEFVFKDVNRGPLSSWINILKNIMPNRDRTFYFNAFFYRLLSDLVKNLDENVYEIMKLNENLTYYMTQNNNLPTESSFSVTNKPIEQKINLEEENKPEQTKLKENEIPEDKVLEEKDLKNSLNNLNINETKSCKNEEIEMFSFESDTEEKYQFYEAKE